MNKHELLNILYICVRFNERLYFKVTYQTEELE